MSTFISFPQINAGVKNPFRWFLSYKKRNHLRRVCKGECKYKLWTQPRALLPFQIYSTLEQPYTITWDILDENGNVFFSPDVNLLTKLKIDNLTYVYYKGFDIGFVLPQGFYTSEISISDGSNSVTWYSEEFYSIGFCSQGPESITDTDLCSIPQFLSGIGSGPYTHDDIRCTICGDNAEDPIILRVHNILNTPLGIYRIRIKCSNMEGTNNMHIDVGGGDQFDVNDNQEHEFFAYSALETEIILTGSCSADLDADCAIPFTGCVTFFSVQKLENQDINDCHIQLKWWGDCGMVGEIFYGESGYENSLFLEEECEIIKIDPQILIEGTENGEKELIPQFKRRTTIYTIELGALPPYLVEALNEMTLHKFIQLTLPEEQGSSLIKNVSIKNDPIEELGGCTHLVTMTFELDDNTVVDGCCDEPVIDLQCVQYDVIPDGDFNASGLFTCSQVVNSVDWNLEGDGSYSTNSLSSLSFDYDSCFAPNKFYRIRLTVTNYNTGQLDIVFDGNSLGFVDANGVFEYPFAPGEISTPSPTLALNPNSGHPNWDAWVKVELIQDIPQWEVCTGCSGWAYDKAAQKVCFENTTDRLRTFAGSTLIISGSPYKIVIDVTITSGGFTMFVGGHIEHFSSSGTYTFMFTASVTDQCYFIPDDEDSQGCINEIISCLTESGAQCDGSPNAGVIADPDEICTNGDADLSATGLSSTPGVTYQWQVSTDNVNWFDVSQGTGENTPNYNTGNISGTKYYRIKSTCNNSGLSSFSDPIQISYDPEFVTIAPFGVVPNEYHVCHGGTANLVCVGHDGLGGNFTPSSVQWTGPNGFNESGNNLPTVFTVIPDMSGDYIVTAVDDNGCTVTATANIQVHPPPEISLDSTVQPAGGSSGEIHCSQIGGTTGGSAGFFMTGTASGFSTTGDFIGLGPGIYNIVYIDFYGCTSDTIIVSLI